MDLEFVVREVLKRLQAAGGAAPIVSTNRQPVAPDCGVITQRLVTLASLEGRLNGVSRLRVPSQAIVTPAVKDELKKRGIRLERGGDMAAPACVSRPLIGLDGVEAAAIPWQAAVGEHEPITRGGAGTLVELLRDLAFRALSERRLAVLATRRAAAAACLAGKVAGLRATVGTDPHTVRDAVRTVGANLLIVDPTRLSRFVLKSLAGEFLQGGWRECPSEYQGILT